MLPIIWSKMTPEQKARLNIDELLTSAGWSIQDMKEINLELL